MRKIPLPGGSAHEHLASPPRSRRPAGLLADASVASSRAFAEQAPSPGTLTTMFDHTANDKGGQLPENGDLKAMIDAEVNEGGPPLRNGESSPMPAHAAMAASQAEQKKSPCPAPNEVVRLALRQDLQGAKSRTLLKTKGFEITRLVVPAGIDIPPHKAPAELTVQCLEGRVAFTHKGSTKEIKEGELLHLCPGEMHSVKGLEDASLLLTLRLPLEARPPTAS